MKTFPAQQPDFVDIPYLKFLLACGDLLGLGKPTLLKLHDLVGTRVIYFHDFFLFLFGLILHVKSFGFSYGNCR